MVIVMMLRRAPWRHAPAWQMAPPRRVTMLEFEAAPPHTLLDAKVQRRNPAVVVTRASAPPQPTGNVPVVPARTARLLEKVQFVIPMPPPDAVEYNAPPQAVQAPLPDAWSGSGGDKTQ
jgi:hypothetical protein